MICTKTLQEMPRQKHLLFNLSLSFPQFITFIDLFTHFVLPILLAHADILYTFFVFITSDPLSHPHFCVELVRGAKYWRFEQVTKAGEYLSSRSTDLVPNAGLWTPNYTHSSVLSGRWRTKQSTGENRADMASSSWSSVKGRSLAIWPYFSLPLFLGLSDSEY